ncbi:unnamed protein product, partial [Urochloa humidicola]
TDRTPWPNNRGGRRRQRRRPRVAWSCPVSRGAAPATAWRRRSIDRPVDGLLVGSRRAAGAAGLARRRVPLRGSPDRAVEAAAGGEHVRVRGRARDVGDAEPHHAGAQAAQPVPAAAAAVGRQVPPLPGLLVGSRPPPRRCRFSSAAGAATASSVLPLSLTFLLLRYLPVLVSIYGLARWALRCTTSIPPRVSICLSLQVILGYVNEQSCLGFVTVFLVFLPFYYFSTSLLQEHGPFLFF